MKFLMLVCVDPAIPVLENDIEGWLTDTGARRLEGDQLAPTSDATTVRDGGRTITDGPFADTKEFIAGYDVLDCADLAEAIEIAAKHPVAAFGAIELRPFWTA